MKTLIVGLLKTQSFIRILYCEKSQQNRFELVTRSGAEQMRQFEVRKKFLTSKIPPFGVNRGQKASVLSTHIDSASAQLIVRYLSSKRPFANSFDKYLSGTMAT